MTAVALTDIQARQPNRIDLRTFRHRPFDQFADKQISIAALARTADDCKNLLHLLVLYRTVAFTGDFCADGIKPLLDFFVAAVDVINPVDYGCAFCSQCRYYKSR